MFTTNLKVRIGDINYGNHLGHDRLITLLHQARIEFFHSLGASESSLFGVDLIMKKLNIHYINEAFLNDELTIAVVVTEIKNTQFTLAYKVTCGEHLIAEALTVMVAFNYLTRKIQALPLEFLTHQETQTS